MLPYVCWGDSDKGREVIGSCSLSESKMLTVFLFSPQFQRSITNSSLLLITDPFLGDPSVMAFKFQLGFLISHKRHLGSRVSMLQIIWGLFVSSG